MGVLKLSKIKSLKTKKNLSRDSASQSLFQTIISYKFKLLYEVNFSISSTVG